MRAVLSSEAAAWGRGVCWARSGDGLVLLVAVKTAVSEPAETEVFVRTRIYVGLCVAADWCALVTVPCRLVRRCGGVPEFVMPFAARRPQMILHPGSCVASRRPGVARPRGGPGAAPDATGEGCPRAAVW